MNNRLQMVHDYFKSSKKLSKIEFSKTLKIAKQTYYKMERGDNNINIDVVTRLYQEYKVNPVWMLTGEGSMFIHLGISSENKINKILSEAESFGVDIENLLSKQIIENIFQKLTLNDLFSGDKPLLILKKIIVQSNYLPNINAKEAKRYLIEKIHTSKEKIISLHKTKAILLFEIEKLTEEECAYLLLHKSVALDHIKKIAGKMNWKAEELIGRHLY